VDQGLDRAPGGEAGGDHPAEGVGGPGGHDPPGDGDDDEEGDDGEAADETGLFSEDGEDEVRVGVGEIEPARPARPETDTEDAPVGQGVVALDHLPSATLLVGEG